MEDNDAQSQLRKVARRRLVGAVVFASVVAVILPMVMDHEPRQAVRDVEIRIPGQDEKPFAPKYAVTPVEKPAAKPAEPAAESKSPAPAAEKGAGETAAVKPAGKPSEVAKDKPEEKAAGKPPEKTPEKPPVKTEKPVAKPEKTPDKAPEKPAPKPEKAAEKAPEKPAAVDSAAEARRAAAILSGQTATPAAAPAKTGEFVILIGAFANEDNVKTLRGKLSEKGVKSYVEPLDTPGGRKTRVRAGPFASREAADQALEKMKQAGVSGVISGK